MSDLAILGLDAMAPHELQPFTSMRMRLSAVRGLRCEINNAFEPELGWRIDGTPVVLPTPYAQRRRYRFTNSGPLVTPPDLNAFAIGRVIGISSSSIFVANGGQMLITAFDLSWNATNGDGGWMLEGVEV